MGERICAGNDRNDRDRVAIDREVRAAARDVEQVTRTYWRTVLKLFAPPGLGLTADDIERLLVAMMMRQRPPPGAIVTTCMAMFVAPTDSLVMPAWCGTPTSWASKDESFRTRTSAVGISIPRISCR